MYEQITIKTLKRQGKSTGEIAREMNCHRNTVLAIVKREVKEAITRDKPSFFDMYQTQIEELLEKGITRLRIWQILKDERQIDVTYDALCKYIKVNLKKEPQSFVVQQTAPAEEAEVDFGYAGLIPKGDGTHTKLWIFEMTLSYSRNSYYEATFDQTVETFIACHQHAFLFFSGVPKTIKLDNLKAAIIKNRRYDLEFNKTYLSFASHCNFIIKPCSPRSPNQKGKVESGIGYVKKNFLAGRTFSNPQDLQSQLKNWMVNTANRRTHGTTKKIPIEVFTQEEKHRLQKLPENPFPIYPTVRRKVKLNCHVQYGENYYSVPARYVGEMVDLRQKDHIVEILDLHGVEIAVHHLCQNKGDYVTNHNHFPQHKVYSEASYQRQLEEKMRAIGPNSHEFFKYLIVRDPTNIRRTIGKILGLVQVYGKEKVEKAIKRALTFNAVKWRAVKNICENNLENMEIEPHLIRKEEPPGRVVEEKEGGNGVKKDFESSLDRDLSYYAKNYA